VSAGRHARQRSNRVRLKADAVVLLERIVATAPDCLPDKLHRQIAEMRMRLAPPTGMKAPIIFTGYTK
jgi:hypothetical protein